jgi:4-hydroxy-tetrahydrodipicolinate synthase
MNKKYSGAWTALATPFTPDFKVNWSQLKNNVRFQVEQGISGVLPMGTTGESPTVTHTEHSKIIRNTVEYAGGKSLVLAGTGSNSTDEAIYETKKAASAGVDACLVLDCYYNKPSSLELRHEYYSVILSEFPDMDFITYAIPGRTVTVLAPEDLAILRGQFKNLVAVKEATGDFERMRVIRSLVDDGFNILSGDDPNTHQMMADKRIGSSGVVSVISNIIPASVERLTRLMLSGKEAEAGRLNDTLMPLFKAVMVQTTEDVRLPNGKTAQVTYKFPNPVPVKTMMTGLGMITGTCKRPLGRLTKKGVASVRQALSQVQKADPGVLQPVADFYDVDLEKRLADDAVWGQLSY